MIGPVTYLDVMVLAVPLLLGLFVMWRGIGRSLLSMPVRLLVSLFLGWVAASAAVIYLEVSHASLVDGVATRVGISGFGALIAMRVLGTVMVFFIVMLILGRIRAHMVGGDSDFTVGAADRLMRFGVGAVLGLVLTLVVVVPNYMLYEAFTPDPDKQPAALRRSLSLPLIKHASEAMRSMLQYLVPPNLLGR